VRVTHEELDSIASFLNMPVRELTEAYCRLTGDRTGLSFIEKENGSCVFLAPDNRCRINPVKPRQCAGFPDAWSFPGYDAVCRGTRASP